MANQQSSYLFTSESVTEGHPDKVCDQISDAILDAILEKEIELADAGYVAPGGMPADPAAVRCACETLATTGLVMVTGEIRTQAYIDIPSIVRGVIADIGYNRAKFGFDSETCGIMNAIHEQSPDIALGVDTSWEAQRGVAGDEYDKVGAGDQGMVFGYACNETKTLMPLPIYLAHRLAEELARVRKEGVMPYLRPDGKTQVSVRYIDNRPTQVEKIVVSTQHAEDVEHEALRRELIDNVIMPVCEREGVTLAEDVEIHVNPTGRFVIGGPMGDAGLTGRKIIVDTYGGMGRHGGGAFSGKDCTKVDRSAAYAARWVAKKRRGRRSCRPMRDPDRLRHRHGEARLGHGRDVRHEPRFRGCDRRGRRQGVRPAARRHRRRARPAQADLSQDRRIRAFRPRDSRVHVGADRSRSRA